MMAVIPSHRGMGIAQQLVMRGVELVDNAGESVYLESTPSAKNMYLRIGFEIVATADGPDDYVVYVMLRRSKQ